jgi:hypothetical protein
MNKSQLETEIGYRIRTASRNAITATEITNELNRSLDRLTSLVDMETSIQTTTIAFTGDGSYALPADFKTAIQLYDRSNNIGYKLVSVGGRIEAEDDGDNIYSIVGSSTTIESATTSTTLTLTYYSTYDAQTSVGVLQKGLSVSTDSPLLDSRFHDYFVEDVSMVLFRKQRKYDDYGIAKKERGELLRAIYDSNPTTKETITQTITMYSESYD